MAMKEIEDEGAALSAIGLSETVSTPDDTEEVVTTTEETDTSVKEETEEEVVTTTEEVSEEKRRSWQSEADRAKAEAQRAKEEAEYWKRNVLDLQNTLKTNQNSLIEILKPKEEKQPVQKKFINDEGYWDQAAFDAWQKAHDEELINQAMSKSKETLTKEQERAAFNAQVEQLVEKYPEYKLPTGEPDYDKIDREVRKITSSKTLVSLFDEVRGVTDSKLVERIEKNAKKTPSVVAGQATSKEPEQLGEDEKLIYSVFGELPDF